MSKRGLHRFRITIPDGRAILTRIELDGAELRGVTFVKVEVGIPERHDAQITLRFFADVEINGELAIIKEWRSARWRFVDRLRYLLGRT